MSPSPVSDSEESQEEIRDLGFGSTVAGESTLRLLNKDGSFNVVRHGLPFFQSVPIYHFLQTLPWWKFYLFAGVGYLGANLLFAVAYLLCGPGALQGTTGSMAMERFGEAFFFSVQTVTTVGYGTLAPNGVAANTLVAVEAFLGLGGFAVMAALIFARLSRPSANILFSKRSVIARYDSGWGFMFRIANGRRSQLTDVWVRVLFSRIETVGGVRTREFYPLELERKHVAFFPLHWTIVHPIDDSSPIWGLTLDDIEACEAEFLVLVSANEETFSQIVHARSSYRSDEIVWGGRFRDVLELYHGGVMGIDLRRLDEIEPADGMP